MRHHGMTSRYDITFSKSEATSRKGEHWRHLGLNSTMAVSFSARLQERLKKCCRDAPAIGPSIMFECRTVSELVSYLQLTRSAYSHSLSEKPKMPERSLEATYVRHVVSLGTLCMTAQAMGPAEEGEGESQCYM